MERIQEWADQLIRKDRTKELVRLLKVTSVFRKLSGLGIAFKISIGNLGNIEMDQLEELTMTLPTNISQIQQYKTSVQSSSSSKKLRLLKRLEKSIRQEACIYHKRLFDKNGSLERLEAITKALLTLFPILNPIMSTIWRRVVRLKLNALHSTSTLSTKDIQSITISMNYHSQSRKFNQTPRTNQGRSNNMVAGQFEQEEDSKGRRIGKQMCKRPCGEASEPFAKLPNFKPFIKLLEQAQSSNYKPRAFLFIYITVFHFRSFINQADQRSLMIRGVCYHTLNGLSSC